MRFSIKKVSATEDFQKCLAIRKKVFVEGQQVPLAEELDGKDDASDHYLLIVNDDIAVGVARVRYLDRIAKVERVAILDEYQGQGLGKQLMEAILIELKQNKKINAIKLSSQCYAIPFYEKLGFSTCSEAYLDAGILHKDMVLKLN
ncbi:GNAT family acetyltransferase [Legionella beliardensis]|uniref:GNAT family acetyltransferase n=1 Tax=Legionella beliardensis TaxID=91822 RepID=A0A378I4B5_9GAMM|nr:GNAT family N-acetyltransferase [Legionella beliardensis]STX30028.1 GNAT family acetyltransferase [Legionella beliardensis]